MWWRREIQPIMRIEAPSSVDAEIARQNEKNSEIEWRVRFLRSLSEIQAEVDELKRLISQQQKPAATESKPPVPERCKELRYGGIRSKCWGSGEKCPRCASPMSDAEKKAYHDAYYKEFKDWLTDPATHWLNAEDAAWQAWSFLHDTKIAETPKPAKCDCGAEP